MFGRIFAASIVSVAMAASSVGVVAHAATVAAPASATTTVTQVTQVTQTTSTATQAATPSFSCVPGIISTICSVVFGPLCKDHCYAAPATAISGTQASATRSAGTAAAASVAAPSFFCQPTFQVVCTVLGATVCKKFPCGRGAATMSAPSFYCDVPLLCTVLALTICRHGCYAEAQQMNATAINNPFGELCTINIRPVNPFCLVP